MKLYGILVKVFIFIILHECFYCSTTESQFNLQNHLTMLAKMKTKTKAMLQNLYLSANRVDMTSHRSKAKRTHRAKATSHANNKFESQAQRAEHFSEISSEMLKKFHLRTEDYVQYRYLNYEEVVNKLKEFAQKHPDYFKLTTAQELYKLPYPGGYCNLEKKSY